MEGFESPTATLIFTEQRIWRQQMKAEELEKGLKNNHIHGVEKIKLMNEYELVLLRKLQIETIAGAFDKRHNIFPIDGG